MYCNFCGTALSPNQSNCGNCGNPVLGRTQVSRVEQHLKLLGVLWIAYAVFHALGGVVLLIVAHTIFGPNSGREHAAFLYPLLSVIAVFVLVKSVGCVAAAVGLIERQGWGRTLSLLMACISLINIPLGTALGVYTLWVLMSDHAESEYRRLAASA
jgi:uncharacterized membrane protein